MKNKALFKKILNDKREKDAMFRSTPKKPGEPSQRSNNSSNASSYENLTLGRKSILDTSDYSK